MPTELHHVAGRRNSALTVPLCVDCHRWVTSRQHALGVPLRGASGPRERRGALVVGLALLLALPCAYGADYEVIARIAARVYGFEPRPFFGLDRNS
jgi:hypothetical protein